MKLSEIKQDFYGFTGKLSDINRQIAFAGIALIWIFREPIGSQFQICSELVKPAIFLVIALGSDLLQYTYQSILWSIYFHFHDKKVNSISDPDVNPSSWLNVPAWFFFGAKVLLVIISYFFIMQYLLHEIFPFKAL